MIKVNDSVIEKINKEIVKIQKSIKKIESLGHHIEVIHDSSIYVVKNNLKDETYRKLEYQSNEDFIFLHSAV